MKKQLLLVLTVVMLMCTVAFGASAARDCDVDGHSFTVLKDDSYVAPGCDTPGYTKYYCEVCDEFVKKNYIEPTGHDYSFTEYRKADNDTYRKYQECAKCTFKGNETDLEGNEIIYYLIQFINGQSLSKKVDSIKYTVLAEETEDVVLQKNYVKQGDAVAYVASKPYRYKDTTYGAYKFVGWVNGQDLDEVNDSTKLEIGDDLYKLVIPSVNASINFYAGWKGENVYYDIIVYSSDGTQLLNPQRVLHGSSISYDYSYAPRESTTSVDFEFRGWIVGDQNLTVDKANAANSTFNYYAAPEVEGNDGIHIKNVPIYAQEAVRAYHEARTRQYKVSFCDEKWNVKSTEIIDYNSDVTGLITFDYANPKLEDENYIYSYTGQWETKSGHKMRVESLALPAGSVDHDDKIYMFDANLDFVKNEFGRVLTVEELKSYYEEELANYKKAEEEIKIYEPGIFDLSKYVYLFPVNEKGEYLLDENGRKVCVVLDTKGIFLLDGNGERIAYEDNDTKALDNDLRTVKIRPCYNRRANTYTMDITTYIPTDEKTPEQYQSGLIVQVTDKNGYLLDSGVTEYNELSGKSICRLYVTKSDKYTITVVSPDEKYVAEKTIIWDVFTAMLNENGQVKEPIIMDMKVSDDYSAAQDKLCSCICHSGIFVGLWVRVLNLIYSIFKVKVVCCYDMYASIGNLLIYS